MAAQPDGHAFMLQLLQRLWQSRTQRVMSITSAGMVVALLADVLIAVRLGAHGLTDALFIALALPRLLGNVGREATKFSLMTVFIHVDQGRGEVALREFAPRVLNLFLVIGLVVVVAAEFAAEPVVWLFGPGLDAQAKAQAAWLLRLCVPMGFFALGSAVLEVALNSRKQFTVTAWRNTIAPLVVVLVILGAWGAEQPAGWIAIGHTAGYALLFGLMLMQSHRHLGFGLNLRQWPGRATLRELRGTVSYPLLGFGVRQGARVAERAIASFAPAGAVTAYYLAFRLVSSAQNLVGVSIALTGQPKLTEHSLAGRTAAFNRVLWRRVAMALAVSVPAAGLLALLHVQVVDLLFGHGRFSADAVAVTGRVVLVLAAGLPLLCLIPVLNSALYAGKRFGAVLYNMVLAAAVNVTLSWLFFQWMGLPGIALGGVAASAVAVLNVTALLMYFQRKADAGPADAAAGVSA